MVDWGQWYSEPLLVDVLVLAGWLYAMAVGPWRSRVAAGAPFSRAAAVRFFLGLGVFYLVVAGPWERVGRFYLFSVHLGGQLLILYGGAGLILSGIPGWLIDPWMDRPVTRAFFKFLFRPLVCGATFILGVSAWYWPRLFEWALRSETRLALQHLSFFGLGILFWWPLISPSRAFPPIRFGGRMIYLFVVEVALTGVFSFILMAEHPMYPTYALAPRIWARASPQDDQVLAGILLSAISSLVMVAALGAAFLRWSQTHDDKPYRQ